MSNHQQARLQHQKDSNFLSGVIPGLLILATVSFLLYSPTLRFDFTDLDDTIFIQEQANYNKKISNIFHSFSRGVFSEERDQYYRPVLLNSFVLNYQFSKEEISGYHAMNILFHLLSVCFLYLFLLSFSLQSTHTLLLSLIFAVHPAIIQAVSWIPGRNDSLLFIFIVLHFWFLKLSLDRQSRVWLALCFITGLLAMFTKETGIFILPLGLIFYFIYTKAESKRASIIKILIGYIIISLIWYLMRSTANLEAQKLSFAEMLSGFFPRSLVAIQYFGKWFFPVNLSVFPTVQDSSFIPGLIAIILFLSLIYFSKCWKQDVFLVGAFWFFLFLVPVFLLPSSLNEQVFEHRLYVPSVGILMMLSQTNIFYKIPAKYLNLGIIIIISLLAFLNYRHQKNFRDPLSFWTSAIQTTPNSAYANKMYATRVSKTNPDLGLYHMKKAYSLNPKEKYVNYHLGKYYLEKDSLALADKMLYEELKHSEYYDNYFQLSRLEFIKKDLNKSIDHLEKYLSKKPDDVPAIQNYLLMLKETAQMDRARSALQNFQSKGIKFPEELINAINK